MRMNTDWISNTRLLFVGLVIYRDLYFFRSMARSRNRGVKPLLRLANLPDFGLHIRKRLSSVLLMQEATGPGVREGHVVFVAGFNDIRGPQ